MKKSVLYLVLIICLLFGFNNDIFADDSNGEDSGSNAKRYSDEDDEIIIEIDKSLANRFGDEGDFYAVEAKIIENKKFGCKSSPIFFTSREDPLLKDEFKDYWWQTLYYCNYDNKFIKFWQEKNIEEEQCLIATDSMASLVIGDDHMLLREYFNDSAYCKTIAVEGVDHHLLVSTCQYYLSEVEKIDKIYYNYLASGKSSKYIDDYRNEVRILKEACNQSFSNASYNDGCAKRCFAFNSDKKIWDARFDIEPQRKTCGFSENILGFIGNMISWIKYIVPILVIIIGIVDFIRAIAGSKDDDMKKAQSRFIRRLIAAALVFIVPSIIVFVLEKMGFIVEGCGIINI